MNLVPSLFFRTLLVMMGGLLLGGSLLALPPAAPSNVRAFVSKRTVETTRSTIWHVTWQDNALDESGYLVRGRVLFQGRPETPYFDWATVPANSTSAVIILNPVEPIYELEFQVVAYKQNGNRIETRVGTNLARARTTAAMRWNPPDGLRLEGVDDGTIKANWNDNSDTEVRFELLVRKVGATDWLLAADPLLGTRELVMRLGLEPNTAYQWAIRAVRLDVFGNMTDRIPSNANLTVVPFTTLPLTPPTNLVATVLEGNRVRLTWQDNSVNAMGYAIEYRTVGESSFQRLTFTGGNDTSFETEIGPGANIEWRVAAAYQPEGGEVVTSAPSNTQVTSTPAVSHPGPQDFAAVATAFAGSVAVRWTNVDPDAREVRILSRVAGFDGDYVPLRTVSADRTQALLTGLTIGVEREFAVVAISNKGESDLSNVAYATPTEGFDPAWYQANTDPEDFGVVALTPLMVAVEDDPETPGIDETQIVANEAVRGQSFAHTLKITNAGSREAWDVTGLPPGMNAFDVETDSVSGVPSAAGVFKAELSLTYVGASPLTAKLVFRVRESLSAPVVVQVIDDRTLGLGSFTVSLTDAFVDPDAPRAAKLETTLGDINLALYENLTPRHVQNFLAYVTAGDYNGVAFHRAVPGFVIQAGGFKPINTPNLFASVAKRPSPFNEPGLANIRGTIAAAKLGGDPDSATTDFFLSLNDNRVNLDNQNSGFTVFGRVTGEGMAVADAIVAKPRGSYSVVIDGVTGTFADWPLNAASASMDVNQTLRILAASEISPLIYSITGNTNPVAVEATITGGVLTVQGNAAGVAVITVTATDLDGQGVSQSFEVTFDESIINPLIVTSPSSQVLPLGADATFTVVAEGTDLVYQWRKNGVPISGEEGSTLVLEGIGQGDEGVYDVLVGNSVKTLTSAPASLAIAAPAGITGSPESVIVRSGTPLTLSTGVTGMPVPTVTWFKNDSPVTGAAAAALTFSAVALTDAGVYRSTVVNEGATVNSDPATVVVVDATPRTVVVKQGGDSRISVLVGKPDVIDVAYLWRRNGVPLVQSNKFMGVATATLTMKGVGLPDAGNYTCDVIAPGTMGTVISGNFNVVVAAQPQLAAVTLPLAYVGREFDFVIPAPAEISQTPTRYTVAGLPPGVRLVPATGRLQGRPTRPGQYPLRIRAFNPAGGSNTVAASLQVIPLPAPTVGVFTGLLARQTVITTNSGGVMTVVINDTGAFTGNLRVPGARYTVRGRVTRELNGVVKGEVSVPRGAADPLAFDFSINPSTGYATGNLRLNQSTNSEIIGWKNVWHPRFNSTREAGYVLADDTAGYFTFSMTPPASIAPIPPALVGPPIPRGIGFASVTVTPSGQVTVKGRTVDGQTVLYSGPLSPNGEFFVYQPLDQNTGSLLGPLRILAVDEDNNGTNEVRVQRLEGVGFDQFKNTRPEGERLYPAGFGVLPLTIKGGRYLPPAADRPRIFRLQDFDSLVHLRFYDGGLVDPVTRLNLQFNLRRNNTGVIPTTATSNPGAVTWTVNARTGLFSGKFSQLDGTVRRNASYFGQLVEDRPGFLKGVGNFQLPQLPTGEETILTSPIRSGRVDLQPNPPID
jgi:cyclophilin family peptidyl-prolyl cis-trans isomerase